MSGQFRYPLFGAFFCSFVANFFATFRAHFFLNFPPLCSSFSATFRRLFRPLCRPVFRHPCRGFLRRILFLFTPVFHIHRRVGDPYSAGQVTARSRRGGSWAVGTVPVRTLPPRGAAGDNRGPDAPARGCGDPAVAARGAAGRPADFCHTSFLRRLRIYRALIGVP